MRAERDLAVGKNTRYERKIKRLEAELENAKADARNERMRGMLSYFCF